MSELRFDSPILLDMQLQSCISEAGGISTYLAKDKYSEDRYVFKNISIPASQTQVEGLKYSGAIKSDEDAQTYYAQVVATYKQELEALKQASLNGNVAAYTSWHVQAKKDGVGYDLHLLAPYRKSLASYLEETPMTQARVTSLAIDLTNSLLTLRSAGAVHCNLKPENIYVDQEGKFCIGDIGVIALSQLRYAAIPDRYLGKYTAPELFDVMQSPGTTIDVYSLGLLLYSIYNGGHDPFEDEQTSSKAANDMRLAGKALPSPIFADYEMAEIVLKACAFLPEERYQSPEELKQELEAYVLRNAPDDTLIVPPLTVDDDILVGNDAVLEELTPMQLTKTEELEEDFVHHFSPDAEVLNESIHVVAHEQQEAVDMTQVPIVQNPEESAHEEESSEDSDEVDATVVAPQKQHKKAWVIAAVAAAIALVLAYFALVPNVKSITVVESNIDSLTLAIDSLHSASSFRVVCTDSYGNRFTPTLLDGNLRFDALSPGTQYTMSIESSLGMRVRGTDTYVVSTPMATTIHNFNAKSVDNDSVELRFEIQGRDQETWSIVCRDSAGNERTLSFSGHSVVVDGLQSDTKYTFALQSTPDIALDGETTVTFDTTVHIVVGNIMQEDTAEGVIITWEFTGAAPESWSVTLIGPDGSKKEQTVTTARAPLFGLQGEADYTLEIFCEGMGVPTTKTIRKKMPTMDSFSAKAAGDGALLIGWSSNNATTEGWNVVVKLASTQKIVFTETLSTNTAEITVTGLVPAAQYDVSVTPKEGWPVDGQHTATVSTAAAKKFASYGCSSTYMGLFLVPNKEGWTITDLKNSRTTFSNGEDIAIVLEAISSIGKSTDLVTVVKALRSSNGTVVAQESRNAVWNDLWNGKYLVDSFDLDGTQSGNYSLELYINGQLVKAKDITLK